MFCARLFVTLQKLIVKERNMNTITINSEIYIGAEEYANRHKTSVQEMVENFLKRFQTVKVKNTTKAELPPKWEKLCGILEGVKDDEDERFNYIINK